MYALIYKNEICKAMCIMDTIDRYLKLVMLRLYVNKSARKISISSEEIWKGDKRRT